MTDEELLLWLRLEDTNLTDFAADRIEELLAERKKDHANINLKADFIDKTINQLAEADAKLEKAVELLEAWGDVAVHCSIEEGVCCCGDNMENHTNPMDCGHTPLDHGTYIAIQLAEETRATLAEIKGESHE